MLAGTWSQAGIPVVIHANRHNIITGLHSVCDVECETGVAAFMFADTPAVGIKPHSLGVPRGHKMGPLTALEQIHRRPCFPRRLGSLATADVDILEHRLVADGGVEEFYLNRDGETTIGRIDPVTGIRPDVDLTNLDGQRSVSRRHAHVDYDVRARDFRITDDRSAHGTSIVRNGVAIPVHPGSRGVRLQSGDEIVLGEARLKVKTT